MEKVRKMRQKKADQVVNEPKTDPGSFRVSYGQAINWYNYNWEEADYRKSALAYLKHAKLNAYINAVNSASFVEIRSIAVLGRLIVRGQYIDMEYFENLLFKLESLKQKYVKPVISAEPKPATTTMTIQERVLDIARSRGGEIDEEIDKFIQNGYKSDFSMKSYLQAKQINGVVAKKIAEFYKAELDEIDQVIKKKDSDLVEAYDHISKKNLKKYFEFLSMVINDCTQQVVVAKAQHKPRARKPKSPLRLTEKMKYMPEFPELKLTSVSASKIIGASELWVYNTDNRKLIVFQAIDKDGLGVSGMSITNFDVSKSEVKTIRDPKVFFEGLSSTGKRAMANAWKSLRAKVSKPRPRINEDMILLAVN